MEWPGREYTLAEVAREYEMFCRDNDISLDDGKYYYLEFAVWFCERLG